jgi:hypothetical protein
MNITMFYMAVAVTMLLTVLLLIEARRDRRNADAGRVERRTAPRARQPSRFWSRFSHRWQLKRR